MSHFDSFNSTHTTHHANAEVQSSVLLALTGLGHNESNALPGARQGTACSVCLCSRRGILGAALFASKVQWIILLLTVSYITLAQLSAVVLHQLPPMPATAKVALFPAPGRAVLLLAVLIGHWGAALSGVPLRPVGHAGGYSPDPKGRCSVGTRPGGARTVSYVQ